MFIVTKVFCLEHDHVPLKHYANFWACSFAICSSSCMKMASVCLVIRPFLPPVKYSFFLATLSLNCAAAVAALNHRLCIWHFEESCPKLLGLKRIHIYGLAYTRHIYDEFIKLNNLCSGQKPCIRLRLYRP